MIRQIQRLVHISTALLLLMKVSVVTGQGNGVYSIYTLPPFAITLFSDWTIMESDLPPTASALQSIAQSYLYDYFHASSLQSEFEATIGSTGSTASSAKMVLHSVELQVSVRMIDSVRIWAELYGNVAFLEPDSTSQSQTRPTPQQMHDLMDVWIAKAFDPQTSLGMFRQRLIAKAIDNLVLLNLKTVEVTLDVQAGPPPPITIPVKTEQADGTWSTPEFVLLGTLLIFIASAAAAIYIFINIERFKYRRDHEFESLQRQADEQQLQQHGQDYHLPPNTSILASECYDQNYNGSPAGRDVVPIVNANGSRRYVDPSLPHQLYYGASHLHSERCALEQEYHTSTMPGRMDHFRGSWLPRFDLVKRFFGQSEKEQDLPFVYRDFPRHDGTPCLIYTPTEEQVVFDADDNDDVDDYNHSPVKAFSIDMGDIVGLSVKTDGSNSLDDDKPLPSNSVHSTNSKQSISSTNSLEQFIERLETLYQLKQKQYKQRMEMERIRRERKLTKTTRAVPVPSKTPIPSHDLPTTPPTTVLPTAVITPDDSCMETPLKSNVSFAPRTPDTVGTTSALSYDTSCIQTPTAEATTTMVMA